MTRAELLADDPFWLILIKVVVLLLLGPLMTMFMIIWERKVVARMQQRTGPNRAGPNGWFQSIADAIKLPFKEQIIPTSADRKVYFLAPILSTIPAILAFSVLPFGPEVSIFGERAPRWACTASCWPAGRPARPTRCSAGYARPPR